MNSKINDDFFEGTSMSFGDHLEELRSCLFRACIWLACGVAVGLFFGDQVMKWVQRPVENALVWYYQEKSFRQLAAGVEGELTEEQETALREDAKTNRWMAVEMWVEPSEIERIVNLADASAALQGDDTSPPEDDAAQRPEPSQPEASPGQEEAGPEPESSTETAVKPREEPVKMLTWQRISPSTEALGVQEAFMIWMKAGIVFGGIIASPGIFWHIWQFIAAGLYPHEKRYVWMFMPFSLALFLGGAAVAYFWAFEPVLQFLFSFNLMTGIDPRPRISEWMGFVLMLPLGFGIAFQLPLVMLLLNWIGLVSIEAYMKQWRIAVMVIFVLAMLLTPADPYSMLLLAIPLTGLYFIGVALCRWMPSSRAPFPTTQA